MTSIVRTSWAGAAIYALVGMGFGIWMSASGNHLYAPAHAHLNLLGWVSIALFGAYYQLFPQAARGLLPVLQVGAMHLATILMFPGVIMAINGTGDALAKAGAVLGVISMLLFLVVVLRTRTSP
ncbi:hypothetical protein [Gellertiella hungarica]|uniref:Cbb3-type cytochrome oxidase subunit 1 n=1 Tax=Gellertiella hungarica TaxID=1572859 RepID=A0A7W6J8Q5_9HYPH|nr:hypothetical protein [Gellertiella hungarica]MBB4066840.1 cbb3-type cytochrome oxidase subunit 1 [Gellertiella hungarica]